MDNEKFQNTNDPQKDLISVIAIVICIGISISIVSSFVGYFTR